MLTKSELLNLIRSKGLEFQIHEHEPLFTVEDSEKMRGSIDGDHTKNLFLKNKKSNFYLFSCHEKAIVNLKNFSKSIDAKNLSFANELYLEEYLGIKPGAVSPFALLNDINKKVTFYFDEKLANGDKINFHPLVNTSTVTIKTQKFMNFLLENNIKINIFSLDTYKVINTNE
jgi:Uncharacterized conserved protein